MFERVQQPDQSAYIRKQQQEKDAKQKKQKTKLNPDFLKYTPNIGGPETDTTQKKEARESPEPKQGSTPSRNKMPEDVQSKMEQSFGTRFNDVNIHTNDNKATDLGALAYTQGKDVHFAPGQYSPKSKKGQELLGHELTHVVQQREGRVKSSSIGDMQPTVVRKSEKQFKNEEQQRDYQISRTGGETNQMKFQLKYDKGQLSSQMSKTHFNNYVKGEIKQLKRNKSAVHQLRSKANVFERQLKRDNIPFGSQEYIQRAKDFFPGFDPVSPLLKADHNFNVNDDVGLEKEADTMGKKAAEGEKANIVGKGNGVQKQADEEPASSESPTITNETPIATQENQIENELTTEENGTAAPTSVSSELYIVDKQAYIRDDTAEHNKLEGNPKIPLWTKVILLESSQDGKYKKVQKADDSNTVWWTYKDNFKATEIPTETDPYTAFYSDIPILSAPGQTESSANLEANAKYIVVSMLECKEGKFALVKKDGAPNTTGWVQDYVYSLYKGAKVTRHDELKKYKAWLDERYTEAAVKTGNDQISFVQGILYQAEVISENIAKETPEYPNTETLSKTPSFSESENTAKGVSVPHELIDTLRKFIEITELKPAEAEATSESVTSSADQPVTENTGAATTDGTVVPSVSNTSEPTTASNSESTINNTSTSGTGETTEDRIVGGSRHSNIDWNTRLKVPQYRTQSDNLTVPEATCSYTSMAMTLERLGNTRSDVVAAIDSKLSEGVENPNLKTLWEQKSKEFFEKITSDASSGYQKLRGNKEGLVGNENELSKVFKDTGQMEDLIYFYKYLLSSNITRSDTFSTYRDKLPEKINNPSYTDTDAGEFDSKKESASSVKLTMEHRNKIKEKLDAGGSVILSVNHKGTSGSHLLYVQSITSEGLIVDDPYGGHAEDYLYGTAGDLFKGKNKTGSRSSYNYKNVVHTNPNETDYSKRDFSVEAAQNLEADESRGKSFLLKWGMITNSSAGFIYYIAYYTKS